MIEIQQARVYRSSVTGRRYLSKGAAINATARGLILKKHPTEHGEHENGYCIDPGFHWSELNRSDVLYRRVCRMVKQRFQPTPAPLTRSNNATN